MPPAPDRMESFDPPSHVLSVMLRKGVDAAAVPEAIRSPSAAGVTKPTEPANQLQPSPKGEGFNPPRP